MKNKKEIERKLYEASKHLIEVPGECFPTTPEAVAAQQEQFLREGPIELPESLRDASKVLERIQWDERMRCPKCGKIGQVCSSDFDWCPACRYDWPAR